MRPTDSIAFLRALGHGPGLVHLALDVGGRRVSQHFVPGQDETELAKVLHELLGRNHDESSALLFGVNPRARERGRAEDVPLVTALCIDFDSQKGVREDLLSTFLRHVPLTALASSGSPGNGHLYWAFEAPVPAQEAASVALRLCRAVGADASWSPAKMMRLPGSMNWKSGSGVLAQRLEFHPEVRTTPAALVAAMDSLGFPALPATSPPPRSRARAPAAVPAAQDKVLDVASLVEQLPPWAQQLVVSGKQEGDRYPSRSEADFAVVMRLLELGATDYEVHAVFTAHPGGIGARAQGLEGYSYLTRTIQAARERLDVATVKVLGVRGGSDRMLLDLVVLDGEMEGLKFTTGVSAGSSAWRWVFVHAGLPVQETVEGRQLLAGRSLRAKLGTTTQGKRQVDRWLPPPAPLCP